MSHPDEGDRGFFAAMVENGRMPLIALAFGLITSGGVALFLAATRHFLPHDEQFLGMTADDLCAVHGCRVVHFMVHDRASFGGVIFAIGVMYLWLIEFPIRAGAAWAWWAILLSGIAGFVSFLAYIGFGYLDAWHGIATLLLLPTFIVGLWQSRRLIKPDATRSRARLTIGRACLMLAGAGATGAGLVILSIGMTAVFVPQDLAYLRVDVDELRSLNPRLVPLIAHDRAGFGGALMSAGIVTTICVWFAQPSRSLWQALSIAGLAGFGPAIGVHYAIGYTDPLHLSPAIGGAVLFATGLVFSAREAFARSEREA